MPETMFVRDVTSQALINPDARGAVAYKTRREKSAKLEELEQNINSVITDIAEIKMLIKKLLVRE